MKSRSLEPSASARENAAHEFYRAVLSLASAEEARAFFADLCTPAELEALLDRWSVVGHLHEGLPYRRIHELTGVSVTTIGRVARFLTGGNGGYRTVLERVRP
ncbi:MAG TPA: YerC/YecD family TrpR-related protein [Gammaproteobacteria bacterium]|nr:YerC/YecD family TrpR-related protein [Gammaproteobacteria bacterium]